MTTNPPERGLRVCPMYRRRSNEPRRPTRRSANPVVKENRRYPASKGCIFGPSISKCVRRLCFSSGPSMADGGNGFYSARHVIRRSNRVAEFVQQKCELNPLVKQGRPELPRSAQLGKQDFFDGVM